MNEVTQNLKQFVNDKLQIIERQKASKKTYKLKLKQANKYKEQEFQIFLKIPHSLPNRNYFRTNYDIQLSLDTFNDNLFGELSMNIFTIGYAVSKTDYTSDKQVFSFEARDFNVVGIDVVYKILDSVNMPAAKKNIQRYVDNHKSLDNIKWASPEEIQETEKYASQFPYECYLIKYFHDGSRIVQYTNNMKYLYLMGITKEMMYHYFSETSTLPCVIRIVSYLDVWNKVFEAVSSGSAFYEIEIQNYNGQRQYTQIEQKMIYMKNEFDGQIYSQLYWIFHTQPNLQIALQNHKDFLDILNPKPKQCTFRAIL